MMSVFSRMNSYATYRSCSDFFATDRLYIGRNFVFRLGCFFFQKKYYEIFIFQQTFLFQAEKRLKKLSFYDISMSRTSSNRTVIFSYQLTSLELVLDVLLSKNVSNQFSSIFRISHIPINSLPCRWRNFVHSPVDCILAWAH